MQTLRKGGNWHDGGSLVPFYITTSPRYSEILHRARPAAVEKHLSRCGILCGYYAETLAEKHMISHTLRKYMVFKEVTNRYICIIAYNLASKKC